MNGLIRSGILRVLVVAGAFALAACGTATPYQPAADGFGYTEQPLEDNRYRVAFRGNTLTSRDTVEDYLLYRAAELTVDKGYDHFVVVHSDIERSTTYHSSGTGFGHHHFHPFHHRHGWGFGGFGTSTAWPQDRYTAFANIVMGKGPEPADDPHAYDAREVMKRLAPRVLRPAPS